MWPRLIEHRIAIAAALAPPVVGLAPTLSTVGLNLPTAMISAPRIPRRRIDATVT
jgi:hypothetical protein